jgi:hypothetical protein
VSRPDYATPQERRRRQAAARRTLSTAVELVEVLDDRRAVFGSPEAMDDPHARARWLLDQSRLTAATRTRQEDR